ncbi:MAG: sulfotransferase [Salibacteraceae bacterium]
MVKLNDTLRDLFRTHGEPEAKMLNPPLFITGCMRSGTTYLVNKLASHPQLFKIGAELNQVWTDIGGAPIKGHCPHLTEEDASPFYTYQMTNYFSNYINEGKSFKRHLMRMAKKSETNLFRVKYDWDNIIPMNKSPHLMNKTRYVNALFPGAKFILIVRDIYAQSASLKFHFKKNRKIKCITDDPYDCWSITNKTGLKPMPDSKKCFPENFSVIPKMWMRLNKVALEEIQLLEPRQYLVLKYEDLILNQEKELARIFNFLGLKDKYGDLEEQIKESAAKKLNTSTKGNPINKWKTQLSKNEIQSIKNEILKEDRVYSQITQKVSELALKKVN